jgi:protein KRI1
MLSRIQQEAGIKAAASAGGGDGGGVDAVLADLLEGEFDPEEYDRRMAAAFSDSYYQGSDDADELFGDGEEELADEGDLEVPAATVAADGAQQQQAGGFAAVRQKQKQQEQQQEQQQAVAEQRGQLQRLLEDYYKLDYEDNIGGLPCRFRYRQVEAESFGLTADDVLTLSDKQLNSVVGLKLLAPYREGHKKLRPNYKALQELKGEAAAAAAIRRQSRKNKKQKRSSEGAQLESLQAVDGKQKQSSVQQQGNLRQQEPAQQKEQQENLKHQHHKSLQQRPQHNNKQKPSKQHKQQKQKQTAAELTPEEKQAARLASYAKLSLKPNRDQQHKLDGGSGSGSKQPSKKRKLNSTDEQQQSQAPQPGRLAGVQLAGPLTKAQKKNLLRALKRKEKQRQEL